MPLFLAAKLFGLPRWAWVLGLIVAAVAGTIVGIKIHDHRVIAQHEAAQAAENARASLDAERRANAAQAVTEAAREQRSTEAAKDMRDAEIAHPEAAKAAAGPVSRASINRLRTPSGQQHPAP